MGVGIRPPYGRQSEKVLKPQLNAACLVVADIFGHFLGLEVTDKMIEKIPGIVYSLAVELGLWRRPYPPNNEGVHFGYYDPPKADREKFIKLIEEAMSYLRKDSAEQKTPLQVVLAYKKEHDMTWMALSEYIGISESHLRQRICNPEYKGSKRSTLEPIAQKLGCEWRDLRWRSSNKSQSEE